MCVFVGIWRPKEGLVSCYYFIRKSLLPSAKALFHSLFSSMYVQNIQTLFIFVQPVKCNHLSFLRKKITIFFVT